MSQLLDQDAAAERLVLCWREFSGTWFHFSLQTNLIGLLHPESYRMWATAQVPSHLADLARDGLQGWSKRRITRSMSLATAEDPGFSEFLATERGRSFGNANMVRVQAIPDELWGGWTAYIRYLTDLMAFHNTPVGNEQAFNVKVSDLDGALQILRDAGIDPNLDVLLFGDRWLFLTEYSNTGIKTREFFDRHNPGDVAKIDAALAFSERVKER